MNKCSHDSVLYCKSYLPVHEYLSMTTVYILIHIDTHWPHLEHFAKFFLMEEFVLLKKILQKKTYQNMNEYKVKYP